MDWAIGAVQNESLAGSILVTLSVARGARPRCAPLASDKDTRIDPARNSTCTAPSAKSIGCNSLDSDTRRPEKAGNFLQKEKQHSGPYMCKGWPMASQNDTPKRPRKIEEDRGRSRKIEEDRGKSRKIEEDRGRSRRSRKTEEDRGRSRKIEEKIEEDRGKSRKRSRKTEEDRGKQKKIEENRGKQKKIEEDRGI